MPSIHDSSKVPVRELAAMWTQLNLAVRAFIAGVVHDSHAVDDILQNVAMTIVDKADSFERGSNFKAWAFAIARQHILSYRKRAAQDRHVFDETMLCRLADVHVKLAPAYEDRRDAMRVCVDALGERNRRVLDLKYRDEMRADRIAELEGMTSNAVYLLLSRVRATLLDCVERRLQSGDESHA